MMSNENVNVDLRMFVNLTSSIVVLLWWCSIA